jgi:hypothetical protein
MTVFFMAATPAFQQNRDTYAIIFKTIKNLGYTLALQQDDASFIGALGDQDTLDQHDWEIMCSREVDAVSRCDLAIFDATNKATFGVGYLAALALQQNKPVLLLLRDNSLQGSIITGLKHPTLRRASFNDGNVRVVVGEFLRGEGQGSAGQ